MENIERVILTRKSYDDLKKELMDLKICVNKEMNERLKNEETIDDLLNNISNIKEYIKNNILLNNMNYYYDNYKLDELLDVNYYLLKEKYKMCKDIGIDIGRVKMSLEYSYNEYHKNKNKKENEENE